MSGNLALDLLTCLIIVLLVLVCYDDPPPPPIPPREPFGFWNARS